MDRVDLDHVPADRSVIDWRNACAMERYRSDPRRVAILTRWYARPLEERQEIERRLKFWAPKEIDHAAAYARRRGMKK